MRLLTLCKRCLLIGCLSVLLPTFAQSNLTSSMPDDAIQQLYHSLNLHPNSAMPARLDAISAQFLGKPYALGALGEGATGYYDQYPLYRTDAFDCETYVDTVLAIAITDNLNGFKQCINQIRYRDGHVSFINRNHFTCLDWNNNNQREGIVSDITTTFRDSNHKPVAQFAEATIDKPSWYSHFPMQIIRIPHLDATQKMTRLQSLKQKGQQLPRTLSRIPYLPLTALFDKEGQVNYTLLRQIPHAAIIEIIRPNWDLSQQIGTHLNISHLGFVFWQQGTLIFRQASSTYGKVIDVSLIDYLRDAQKSPTIKGINVQIVNNKPALCTLKHRR